MLSLFGKIALSLLYAAATILDAVLDDRRAFRGWRTDL